MKSNEFNIQAFTTEDIDSIPIESGLIHIDAYYQKESDDALSRLIKGNPIIGDIPITDIVFMSGNPTEQITYARYIEDGVEYTVPAQLTSEGEPVQRDENGNVISAIKCSAGAVCLDLVNKKMWQLMKQGDYTSWEYVRDAEPIQLERLRYEDIDRSKYYWDSSEQAMYYFDDTKELWSEIENELIPTNGDPAEVVETPSFTAYYYDETGVCRDLKYYDRFRKKWEAIREVDLLHGHPEATLTELYDIDQEKYYIDLDANILYRFNHPWKKLIYELKGVSGDPRNLGTSLSLIDSSKYYFDYTQTETMLYRFHEDDLKWYEVRKIIISEENPAFVNQDINNIFMEKYYYWIDTDEQVFARKDLLWSEIAKVLEEDEESKLKPLLPVNGVTMEEQVDPVTGVPKTVIVVDMEEKPNAKSYYYDRTFNYKNILQYIPAERRWEVVQAFKVVDSNPKDLYTNYSEVEPDKMYFDVTNNILYTFSKSMYFIEKFDDKKIYRFTHSVYLQRTEVEDKVYESMCEFYKKLMAVYFDVNNQDRLVDKDFICTAGHPAHIYVVPDTTKIYVDTTTGKFYRPLENGMIPAVKPYTMVITNELSAEDIDMVEGTYYLNVNNNKCYMLVDGLKQEVKIPATPIDLSTIDGNYEFNRYYVNMDTDEYFIYNPYQEIISVNDILEYLIFVG